MKMEKYCLCQILFSILDGGIDKSVSLIEMTAHGVILLAGPLVLSLLSETLLIGACAFY